MAKVLLVEDDNNLREIFEMRLQAEGYQTVTAGDGEEALVVAMKEKPDLVIADVMMPKLSGFEMLETMRAAPELKTTKVIMMTALGQAEDRARGNKLGVVEYLVKSQVTLEDFVRVVREVLQPAEAGAKSAPAQASQSSINKESEKPMDDTQPTNPAPADGGSAPASNPIAGDNGAMGMAQEHDQMQKQMDSFGSGAPAGGAMPAADASPAADGDSPVGGGSDAPAPAPMPDVPPAGDSPAPAPGAPTPPAGDGGTPPSTPGTL